MRALVYFIGILSTFLRPGRQAEAAVGAGRGFFGVQNMDVAGKQAGLEAIHDRFQKWEAGKNDTQIHINLGDDGGVEIGKGAIRGLGGGREVYHA